tara:strand:+ start:542 stop:799 length:258 start_codon:yes stop_codon:yes gene_type:complete
MGLATGYNKSISKRQTMFYKALEAPTLEEAIFILDVKSQSTEDLEEMAWSYAFLNGDSSVPPTEREEALAGVCLDELDLREETNN